MAESLNVTLTHNRVKRESDVLDNNSRDIPNAVSSLNIFIMCVLKGTTTNNILVKNHAQKRRTCRSKRAQ